MGRPGLQITPGLCKVSTDNWKTANKAIRLSLRRKTKAVWQRTNCVVCECLLALVKEYSKIDAGLALTLIQRPREYIEKFLD